MPFVWNANIYNSAGIYTATLTSAGGCDSLATLNLIVNPVENTTVDLTICNIQIPYNWNGNNYARYSNADFDKMMSDLAAETDAAKRADIVKKAAEFVTQNVVVIPLVNRTFATSAKSKTLKGVNPTPWDSEMYNVADWSK